MKQYIQSKLYLAPSGIGLYAEKTKIEEKRKLEEQDVVKLMKEKAHSDVQISNLKHKLESLKGTYETHSLQMEVQAKETKAELEKKELRVASESIKQEILKTQKVQSKEFNHFGLKLKGLVDAAQNYHTVLEENRKLYNEVQDLKVKSTADVLDLMNIGLTNRAIGATALNERSSRSHRFLLETAICVKLFFNSFFLGLIKVYIICSVLTVHVRGTDLKTSAVLRCSLHLVDLAGSERVDRSEATEDRLRQAQHINKSLSALGDVMHGISRFNGISYPGGQAKTIMFVQLNPDVEYYPETISTLKFAERVAFLKDTVVKKDEEIGRLRTLKPSSSGEKCGISSPRYGSSSPRRHSIGTPRETRKLSGGKSLGRVEKAASDVDNSSEYSDRHSEAGSQQSLDDFRHHKEFFRQSRLAVVDRGQILTDDVESNTAVQDGGRNLTEDFELLGFGDADSEERLSDIPDGVLSMGTETDGSINSMVEFTLFPETAKQPVESIEK
ncbi:hypothetical protein RJ639_017572 [Escallonia herrerae]|uniref:Kinesin motor domain-containing protein n=1 Tax=Escallonia herrerae TaxID=1293975 RepID=A0AA89AKL4_9ASTE|nr:hypothetical protein RJ639_017572 [Escallonia herrerae]